MATATRRSTRSAKRAQEEPFDFAAKGKEFIGLKDQTAMLTERQNQIKDEIMGEIERRGEKDEKGSLWIELDEPIVFTDRKGKTFRYTALKRQRSLTPADPTPDEVKTEELLKKKGMWLTPEQEKQLQRLRIALRFARITVEVSPDAVAEAYFEGLITEDEYDSILVAQKEGWSFVQLED